jgi:hypothetical protein
MTSAQDRVDIFVLGENSYLFQKSWDGTRWGEWVNHKNIYLYKPVAISRDPSSIDLFLVDTEHGLRHKHWSASSGWGEEQNPGGAYSVHLMTPPTVVATKITETTGTGTREINRLDVFVIGRDHTM